MKALLNRDNMQIVKKKIYLKIWVYVGVNSYID